MSEPLELRIVGQYNNGVIAAKHYDRYIIEEHNGMMFFKGEYKSSFLPLYEKVRT
jgi:hypothetical protein